MTIDILERYKVLKPAEDMWLYNGDVFSDEVTMPLSADESAWQEVTDEFKQATEESEVSDEG